MSLSQKQRDCLQELAREAQAIVSQNQPPHDRPMTFAKLEEAGDFMTALTRRERG